MTSTLKGEGARTANFVEVEQKFYERGEHILNVLIFCFENLRKFSKNPSTPGTWLSSHFS